MSEAGGTWWTHLSMNVNSPDLGSLFLRKSQSAWRFPAASAAGQHSEAKPPGSGDLCLNSAPTLCRPQADLRAGHLLFFRGLSHTLKAVENSALAFNTLPVHAPLRLRTEIWIGQNLVMIFWVNGKRKNINIPFPVMPNCLGVDVQLSSK